MNWETLEKSCRECENCRLAAARNSVVFGTGPKNAPIMLIGEGPGENEDNMGLPFVGAAGKLLDDMLEIIDLSRNENVYITNIVKCRPPKNRDPQPDERTACLGWLREQMSLLRPKIVVCLGRIAAITLIKPDFKITSEHGQVFDKNGIKFIAILHPSALLRDPSRRPGTFVDLKKIQSLIYEICPEVYADIQK